jgi:hypothetical protein
MANQHLPHNGHRVARHGFEQRDWQSTARDAFQTLSRMDVPDVVRKNPVPSLAIAGAAGLLIGITIGSRIVRMIVGSVGMYAISELGRRYARQALEDVAFEGEDEPIGSASE